MTAPAAWADYVAARRDLRDAAGRLLAADFGPGLRHRLAGGPGLGVAVEFLATACPRGWVADNLDVVFPRAVGGGRHQRTVRDVLLAADRDALTRRLPELVASALAGSADQPDDRYFVVVGLVALLEMLGDKALLAQVVAVARAAGDPDLEELVEDYPDSPAIAPPAPSGVAPEVDPAEVAEAEWEAYAAALRRYRKGLRGLSVEPVGEVVAAALERPADVDAAGEYVARLVAEPTGDGAGGALGEVRAALRRAPAERLAPLWPALVAAAVVDDAGPYRNLVDLLASLDLHDAVRAALARGRTSPNPAVRAAAGETPDEPGDW
ncbi:MAG: hypothetical protein ACJ73S_27625 [Mycobacteriales bacterium]